MIDAKIKTIKTKENSDDMLYPVVSRLKMITSAAIPIPLKKCFPQMAHSFLFNISYLYSRYGRQMSNDMKNTKQKKDGISSRPRHTLKIKIVTE